MGIANLIHRLFNRKQYAAPEYFTATLEILDRTFPDGVSMPEYGALISIMSNHYSQRNLADILWAFTKKEYYVVYNDILGAAPSCSDEVIETTNSKLIANGYDEYRASSLP